MPHCQMNVPHLLKRRNFNDSLALVLVVLIIGLWAVDTTKRFEVPALVLGATIPLITKVVDFYFRKAPPRAENDGPPKPPGV